MPYTVITLGGVALGVGIDLMFLIRWWFKEKRDLTALVPYLVAKLYGMLAALAAGSSVSALSVATWITIWAANVGGYAGLVWGVGGSSSDVTRGNPLVLDPGGYVVIFLFTLVFIALWKWAPRVSNGKLGAGAFSGVAEALSGTVAGAAAIPLGTAVNLLGVWFTKATG
ncbi:hypothetical protein [Streptomyces sp. NPDC004658]|uniref:hypothetical protein n=1 Tax=Streptomyces sp. NPDC004658 TaxID=3154672 RepID=UPI0033A8539F